MKPDTQYLCDQAGKYCIDTAIQRNWTVHHKDINVQVSGNRATLTGTVESWHERTEAENIALRVNGISSVTNHLMISNDIL